MLHNITETRSRRTHAIDRQVSRAACLSLLQMPSSPTPPAKRIVRRRRARGANRLPMSPASETGKVAAAATAATAAAKNACLGVSSENPGISPLMSPGAEAMLLSGEWAANILLPASEAETRAEEEGIASAMPSNQKKKREDSPLSSSMQNRRRRGRRRQQRSSVQQACSSSRSWPTRTHWLRKANRSNL